MFCFLAIVLPFDECKVWFYSLVIFSEGYRHPSSTTVARTVRILHTLLGLVGKHRNCDKFEVNTQSVAYLAGEGKEHKPSHNIHNNTCLVFNGCAYASCSSAHGVRGGTQSLQSQTQEVFASFRCYHGELPCGHLLSLSPWAWMQVRPSTLCLKEGGGTIKDDDKKILWSIFSILLFNHLYLMLGWGFIYLIYLP